MSPRLFVTIMSSQARRLMSYRADFWIQSIFVFLVQFGISYFLWQAIFRESGRAEIGGYAFRGMVLYYILVALVQKLVRGTMTEGNLSLDIYDGSLSRYLLYPVNYFTFKYAQRVGELLPAFIQFLLLGTVGIMIVGIPDGVHITPLSIAMGLVAIAMAGLLNFALYAPVEGVAFWADNVWALNVMVRMTTNVLGGVMLPLTVFPDAMYQVLRFTPFPYLFYAPVETLLGRVPPMEWAAGLGVSAAWILVIGAINHLIWKRGDLEYTGVGI